MIFPDGEDRDGSWNIGLFTVLMQLLARESFIEFTCHKSFRLYFLSTS
jgi:hypothetical protein